MHLAATSQSLILAGESIEVDALAKRATLVKGQSGGPMVHSEPSAADAEAGEKQGDSMRSIINYELWVSTASSATRGSRSPIDLYKRTVQGATWSRSKLLDVFA